MSDDQYDPLSGAGIESKQQNVRVAIILSILACFPPFMFGWAMGFTSPALPAMMGQNSNQVFTDITCEDDTTASTKAALFSSMISVGAMAGALSAGKLADTLGRPRTLALAALPMIGGYVWLAFTRNPIEAILTRVVIGVGVGIGSVGTPVYINEVAPVEYRGVLGGLNQLTITIGIFAVYLAGALIQHSETTYQGCDAANGKTIDSNWPILAWIGVFVSTMQFVVSLLLPETPAMLYSSGREDDARDTAARIWGPSYQFNPEGAGDVDGEGEGQAGCSDLMQPSLRRQMIVGPGILIFQQIGGINAVIFFAGSIFKSAGVNNSDVSGLYVMSVQVVATLISINTIDRLGRRSLLMTSTLGMTASAVLLGVFFFLKQQGIVANWLALVSLMGYIVTFSMGMGPVPWILVNEIFPSHARAAASALGTTLGWSCAFLITETFVYLKEGLQPYGTFWLYAAICAAGFCFTAALVPETKGLTEDEIQAVMRVKNGISERSINGRNSEDAKALIA